MTSMRHASGSRRVPIDKSGGSRISELPRLDLPVQRATWAGGFPFPKHDSAYDWSGLYAGGHLGVAWG